MVLQNATLVGSGLACLSFAGFVLYSVLPREGRPESVWTKTEMRSTLFALGLVTTVIFGIALVVRGFLS
jgi:hypothetical protein